MQLRRIHSSRLTREKLSTLGTYAVAVLLCSALGACGGMGGGAPNSKRDDPKDDVEIKTPRIVFASPAEIAVGEAVQIVGEDFVEPQYGKTALVLRGSFNDGSQNHDVDLEVKPSFRSATELSWNLWPDVVFHPNGNQPGTFTGELVVINRGHDGTEQASDPQPVTFNVKPSLVVRQLRPNDSICAEVVPGTQAGIPFSMGVEAIGLTPPLQFTWTFDLKHWDVKLKHLDTLVDNAEQLLNNVAGKGTFEIQETRGAGTHSAVREGGGRATDDSFYAFKIIDDTFTKRLGTGLLANLRTARIPEGADSYTAQVHVTVTDSANRQSSLTIPVEVKKRITMEYDGSYLLAERFAARQLTGCIPGGGIGRHINYRDDRTENERRDIGFNWGADASFHHFLGLKFEHPWHSTIDLNGSFDVSNRATVSSTTTNSVGMSAQIVPGTYAVLYRQKTKIIRLARLTGHGVCGESIDMGEAVLTDWLFSPDIAIGKTCPPPTRLPPAKRVPGMHSPRARRIR